LPTKITGDTLKTVRRHIQEAEMSKWLAAPRKNGREPRLSLTRQQLINTKAITDLWKDILHGQRKWLTKMSQRFAPVGKNMHRWGFWTNSRCPACHRDNEDEDHLFNAPDVSYKKGLLIPYHPNHINIVKTLHSASTRRHTSMYYCNDGMKVDWPNLNP
jgi:hypothetical protein